MSFFSKSMFLPVTSKIDLTRVFKLEEGVPEKLDFEENIPKLKASKLEVVIVVFLYLLMLILLSSIVVGIILVFKNNGWFKEMFGLSSICLSYLVGYLFGTKKEK